MAPQLVALAARAAWRFGLDQPRARHRECKVKEADSGNLHTGAAQNRAGLAKLQVHKSCTQRLPAVSPAVGPCVARNSGVRIEINGDAGGPLAGNHRTTRVHHPSECIWRSRAQPSLPS